MPPKPDLETQDNVLFYDMASFIDDGAEKRINDKLVKFFRETSNQIAIVVADDLCGYEPAQYATRLGHDWGVGREKEDNGVVILMRPKRDGQKGEIFIATGYGMEGPIPDVYANRITDNIMIPYFKQNQYPQGLEAGMQVVMDLAQGEYNEQVAMVQGEGEGEGEMISLFMIFILILLALMAYSYHRRVTNYAEVNKLAYWAAFFMLMNQHGHTGSFDDFNQAVFANGSVRLGRQLWQKGDMALIDGVMVNGTAKGVGLLAGIARHLQSGMLFHYAFAMILGLLAMLTWFLFI